MSNRPCIVTVMPTFKTHAKGSNGRTECGKIIHPHPIYNQMALPTSDVLEEITCKVCARRFEKLIRYLQRGSAHI